eukprot:Hpha_TRINITY_DN15613_c1_g2::TRINITY_DN15613_c1_g2_i3::g.100117::m.100117
MGQPADPSRAAWKFFLAISTPSFTSGTTWPLRALPKSASIVYHELYSPGSTFSSAWSPKRALVIGQKSASPRSRRSMVLLSPIFSAMYAFSCSAISFASFVLFRMRKPRNFFTTRVSCFSNTSPGTPKTFLLTLMLGVTGSPKRDTSKSCSLEREATGGSRRSRPNVSIQSGPSASVHSGLNRVGSGGEPRSGLPAAGETPAGKRLSSPGDAPSILKRLSSIHRDTPATTKLKKTSIPGMGAPRRKSSTDTDADLLDPEERIMNVARIVAVGSQQRQVIHDRVKTRANTTNQKVQRRKRGQAFAYFGMNDGALNALSRRMRKKAPERPTSPLKVKPRIVHTSKGTQTREEDWLDDTAALLRWPGVRELVRAGMQAPWPGEETKCMGVVVEPPDGDGTLVVAPEFRQPLRLPPSADFTEGQSILFTPAFVPEQPSPRRLSSRSDSTCTVPGRNSMRGSIFGQWSPRGGTAAAFATLGPARKVAARESLRQSAGFNIPM